MADYDRLFCDLGEMGDETIAWLEQRPNPIAWHRSAYSWNWDQGYRTLGWIVSQPNCDRATAIHIFWAALPHEALDPQDQYFAQRKADPSDLYHLLELIIDLLAAGRFSQETFETQWSEEWESSVQSYKAMLDANPGMDAKWRLALEFLPKRPIYEWNAHPGYPEGIPMEIYKRFVGTWVLRGADASSDDP